MSDNLIVFISVIIVLALLILFGMEGIEKGIMFILDELLLGDGIVDDISENVELDAGVSYDPPIIPLVISYDSTNGLIITAIGELPTPIGTFAIYKNVSFPDRKTLTIVLNEEKYIYDLGDNKFEVQIPNDKDGNSTIEYEGDGNIIVIIPNPVFNISDWNIFMVFNYLSSLN